MNNTILAGRLTKEPELKAVNDKTVASFSLAVKREFAKDKTDFFNCEAWGKTAEFLAGYGNKGDLIAVSGRLQQDIWEKDGKKYSAIKVVVDRAEKLAGVKKEQKQGEIDFSEIPF